jgi:hypothetical protein
MSDTFSQEASVSFGKDATAGAWRIAEDIRALMEVAFGEHWKLVELEYNASSSSNINFSAKDLTGLQSRVEEYGGPLQDIAIYANHWANNELRSCDAIIWIKDGKATGISLSWHTPLRVDTEAFRYSVERVVNSYRRRKRWSESGLKIAPVRHDSDAGASPSPNTPLLKVRGVKWGLRRWFVQNRDSIIISLAGGIVVAVAIIVLQMAGIIPVPG